MSVLFGEPVPPARILLELAQADPERIALKLVDREGRVTREVTRAELDRETNRAARLLADRGVEPGAIVGSLLGNSWAHFLVTFGATKAGACILPLNPGMPPAELEQVLDAARPRLVLRSPDELADLPRFDSSPVPDRNADPGIALASGGSTGRPKIIVSPGPIGAIPHGFFQLCGHRPGMVQLLAGPTFHNRPFIFSFFGLLMGDTLVVMEKFDASLALDLIERQRVQYAFLVPTMLRRLLAVDGMEQRDLSSLEGVLHSAAPCPPAVKRAWLDLIGPERLYEGYGASEGVGGAVIRGDEWLRKPGSVGRPYCEVRIQEPSGSELAAGEVGEIFMRLRADGAPTYRYLGSPPAPAAPDGFVSVGDLGWLDSDGYLYIADRRTDLIITGGENVYPAEVEAALAEHADVADAAVVGLLDPEWGRRVHAVVQPRDPARPPAAKDLDRFARQRLAAYKVPRSYEFTADLGRTEAGKLRRAELAGRASAAAQA